MNLYLEFFGYLGTALVLLSMMMSSIKLLRLFNMSGAVISAIYGIFVRAWPVVTLNMGLIIIHIIKLWRLHRNIAQGGTDYDIAH